MSSRAASILIVDDDANLRQNIHFILEKGGMKSSMASSGEEALQRMRTTAFDLVLLDVQMPGMGGLEALRIMRERHPDVGVIMCSVLKDIAVAVEAMHTGALDYVTNDFSPRELIAHERGSFTGADRQKLGKFELANGGTLFLDEIGDLALDLQAKILRALQEHEIERVGGEKPILLDLRVICATNRDLAKLVQEGRFREDLFWRLKVVPIELPPLRERREDIRDLAQHFLARNAAEHGRLPQTLSDGALQLLERYRWPGNIRELENIMARMTVVCDSEIIEEADLPFDFALSASAEPEAESGQSLEAALLAFEKSFLRKALKRNQWNRKRTAELLQIGYSTLKAKLKSYGIVAGADGDED